MPLFRPFLACVLCVLLAACAMQPVATISRDADLSRTQGSVAGTRAPAQEGVIGEGDGMPQPVIRRGSTQRIKPPAAPAGSAPVRTRGGTSLVFQDEPIQSIVAVILGEMLGQNYVIAPGVQGTVNINTPRPVTQADALKLLESILSFNNARMIWADGRYNIVPADQAVNSGLVAPSAGAGSGARGVGYQVRPYSLRYVSAMEMEKILKPYARGNAIVNVDNGRNVITLAGTPSELENYRRTIQTFDVDWMSSMSVGVFPLRGGRASQVVSDLERVFGEQSRTPVAGMFRFMPLEASNSVMVIASQPDYLDDIQQWIDRIDGNASGGTGRLYTYELRYVKARDLAQRLAEVFGSAQQTGAASPPSLMPGLTPTEIVDPGVAGGANPSSAAIGAGGAAAGSGLGSGQMSLPPAQNGGASAVKLQVNGDQVGVAAVEESNALLVRASPAAWNSIREVIQKLDVMPLQVHIEAQVVEVKLTGALSYGVNWYLENGIPDPTIRAAAQAKQGFGAVGGSITNTGGLMMQFLGHNSLALLTALDKATDVRLLQTPSILVRNNAEATLNVGSRIPIASVTVNPASGNTNTYSQVQYLDTGTILKVRPRVTREGMVFLDIVQEVSTPGSVADAYGNVRIDTRRMKTEAAVQSGDTVMLAGLISDGATKGTSGVPFLSRIPVIGGLFGVQSENSERTEVIVLLTPTLVRDPAEARALTDEYGRRFRGLRPIKLKTPENRR